MVMIHLFTPNSILPSGALKMVKNHPRVCADLMQLLRPHSAEPDSREPLTVQSQTPGTMSQCRASSQGPLSAEPVEHESLSPASILLEKSKDSFTLSLDGSRRQMSLSPTWPETPCAHPYPSSVGYGHWSK